MQKPKIKNHASAVEYFNDQALTYVRNTEHRLSFAERYEVFRTLIEKYASLDKSDSYAADIGCGNGCISEILLTSGYRVSLYDGSRMMLDLAEKKLSGYSNERWITEEAVLPFSADKLEHLSGQHKIIVLSSVIEYISQWELVLAQVHEMLECGGIAIVSFPNRSNWYRLVERVVLRALRITRHYSGHIKKYYDVDEVTRSCEGLGYKIRDKVFYSLPRQELMKYVFGGRRGRLLSSMFVVVLQK
ncbi:MAG TPA: class I SAM-dependent methyltransferase [Bacteroidota bacterium]|nr:class I SAM-dependent methyltransferase [Bacteroidota bacterium]